MHLGAGFWVGLFFLYVFSPKVSSFKVVLNIILWVLLIALLWELFELIVYNFIGEIPFDTLDTIGDIFFGLTGGFLAVFYYFKKVTPTEGKLL
ncbi:MAG: hypothetical protein Q8O46_03050 [bacterium]|nr:hypothetical protein [bacterium]